MSQVSKRAWAGLATVLALLAIFALAVALFRGSFTETVPVTVISERAGLVMNPDAKVKMRGVQVGTVDSIEARPDGTAALHLAMDPSQLRLIPDNVRVDIASTTVFGAKFVQLVPPPDPSQQPMRPGQTLNAEHVTVEINTVWEKLNSVLTSIEPVKLNETLGAISAAFNGRGEKFGETITDFNALLAKIEPSLPNLSRDIEATAVVANAYADAAPDLIRAADNATRLSDTLVDEQQNLDAFLVSAIGLADIGNEVVGGNRQALSDVLRLLVPTTDLLDEYNAGLKCSLQGMLVQMRQPPAPDPGIAVNRRLHAGHRAVPVPDKPAQGRRQGRSPLPGAAQDSIRVAAQVPRRRHRSQPLPVRQPGHPAQHRWPQAAAVRADRRPAAQHRADRATRMRGIRGTIVKFGIFAVVMALVTVFLFMTFSQYRAGSTNGYSAVFDDASRLKEGDTVRVAGIRVGTVDERIACSRTTKSW